MTRDDISTTTGATNGTTFIGVIDAVDGAARRATMMKKSIAASARNLKDELKSSAPTIRHVGKFASERRSTFHGSGSNNNDDDLWKSKEVYSGEMRGLSVNSGSSSGVNHDLMSGPSKINPFDSSDDEEDDDNDERRVPPSPAKGLGDKFKALPAASSFREGAKSISQSVNTMNTNPLFRGGANPFGSASTNPFGSGSTNPSSTGNTTTTNSSNWDTESKHSKSSKTGSKSSKTSKDGKSKSKRGRKSLMTSIKSKQALIETANEQQKADALEREARRQRVKGKLEKYKSDRKLLQTNCATLETQLVETAEKLREVDSKAAYKIDSLEAELEKTREGMESLVVHSTKEVTDQSQCIKTLGKKLIRQAHVIKGQKKAVAEYQIQLEALREEMAMQDERDSDRDGEYNNLKEDFERTLQQKVAMQDSLQESIEEMMDLRHEREMHTARIRELELTLQEKEIDLERAKKENAELNERVTKLETDYQDKVDECEVATSKLEATEQTVDVFKSQLRTSSAEIEDLREKADALSTSQHRGSSFKGWGRGSSVNNIGDETTFEEKLQAKEMQIEALDQAAKESEETINKLRSDMVKMSSTFKQEDYLKRKQIAKLKQANAEYALKLRALEKAFKGVHGETRMSTSLHAQSMHASTSSQKSEMAQAVNARLGCSLAPYEFPSITSEQNSEETYSDEGRKGEWPEEC